MLKNAIFPYRANQGAKTTALDSGDDLRKYDLRPPLPNRHVRPSTHVDGKRVNQDPRIVSFALDAFQLQCVALGL
jgi:hypothetical protein